MANAEDIKVMGECFHCHRPVEVIIKDSDDVPKFIVTACQHCQTELFQRAYYEAFDDGYRTGFEDGAFKNIDIDPDKAKWFEIDS